MMGKWFLGMVCLWCLAGAARAQQPAPPPQPVVQEPKKAEPAKAEESAPQNREPPSAMLHYTLAAIGLLIVMVLICMPARRE